MTLLKNLRVAVVPTETGNGIDQNSSVKQILDCPETKLYAITDYFQAQNNEDLPLLHWSFLIDIETNANLTGTNIKGVHYDTITKTNKIAFIKDVIAKWGETSDCELELESSPCLSAIGGGDICELVEDFCSDHVRTTVYNDQTEIEFNHYRYEELPDRIIDEIYEIMKKYNEDPNNEK